MKFPDRDQWKQVGPVLDELLDLGVSDRIRRLTELCLVDAVLGAELRSLLDSLEEADSVHFLERCALVSHGWAA